jgi:signal transduction histidine kinase
MEPSASPDEYHYILGDYVATGGEDALYRASLLSQACIESGLGPEDIVALHFEALERILAARSPMERLRCASEAQQFLLEVMIAYGVRYREYLDLRLKESLQNAEARGALERERSLDAERLERERADMLAVIAHELRTPLTAALGQLDLAERFLQKGSTEQVRPLLGSAREALQRLSRLSADLVEATHGGAPALNPAPLRLQEVVAQACAWAAPAATEQGVTLVRDGHEADVSVVADCDALLSVLGNLLSNAIRYTPSGGKVMVRYGRETDHVWLEVQDTGLGMTPEVQARVFEKFYRGQEARALEPKGLGLGLSLVAQLVTAHRGEIQVQSQFGHGSAFRVVLPLPRGAAEGSHDGTR